MKSIVFSENLDVALSLYTFPVSPTSVAPFFVPICFSTRSAFDISEYGFDQQRFIWYVCRLWDMVFS